MRTYALLLLTLSAELATAANQSPCPLQPEALERLQSAARTGQAEAQFQLGIHRYRGKCLPTDLSVSTRWFRQAAEQGHVAAAFNLGNAYHHGRGIAADPVETRYWWRQAAFQGLPNAAYNLGVWHLKHDTTTALRELGVAWLEIAAAANWADAVDLLDKLPVSSGPGAEFDWGREPLRSESKLLTRSPQGFVIQLFSGDDAAAARRFIKQLKLERRALIFRLPVDGQFRWNVAFGHYPNRITALRTLRTLRDDLAQFKPWPRSAAEIQGHIRHVWQQREDTRLADQW